MKHYMLKTLSGDQLTLDLLNELLSTFSTYSSPRRDLRANMRSFFLLM